MNEEQEKDRNVLSTYVHSTDKGSFNVSTAYRRASTLEESWYFETFAWRWDTETKERTDWVADFSGAVSFSKALLQHAEVCRQLYEYGVFKDPSEKDE